MKFNKVKMPKSTEYNRATQREIIADVKRAEERIDALCEKLYRSIVIVCKHNYTNDLRFFGIEQVANTLIDDADLIHDVCKRTHSALCEASRVYSYASEHLYEGEPLEDLVCALVEDYLNERSKSYFEIGFFNGAYKVFV